MQCLVECTYGVSPRMYRTDNFDSISAPTLSSQVTVHQQYSVSPRMHSHYRVSLHQQSPRMHWHYRVSLHSYNIESISAPAISSQDPVILHHQYRVSPRMYLQYNIYMISLHQQHRVSPRMYLQYAVSHRTYVQYRVSSRVHLQYESCLEYPYNTESSLKNVSTICSLS